MYLFYLILRSGVLIFRIPKHQSVCQEFLDTLAYEDQFCVCFSLARQRTAGEFFLWHFLRNKMALSFFFLLSYASLTWSMPRQYFFCSYLLPNRVKYHLNSQNFPPF